MISLKLTDKVNPLSLLGLDYFKFFSGRVIFISISVFYLNALATCKMTSCKFNSFLNKLLQDYARSIKYIINNRKRLK